MLEVEREIFRESPISPSVIASVCFCLHKKYFICRRCEQRHRAAFLFFLLRYRFFSLSVAMCHACGWLALVFSAQCVFLGVCLCTLGCQPSIILAPSGLCVGLFHQHHHLLVFYSGPQGYNDCTTFQICSSSPSDWLPYPKSGSYFLSVLYSLAALQLKMVRT